MGFYFVIHNLEQAGFIQVSGTPIRVDKALAWLTRSRDTRKSTSRMHEKTGVVIRIRMI